MNDCKENILKFVEEKKYESFGWEWKVFEEKTIGLEKEINEKGKEPELQIISPPTQVNTYYLVQAM